MANSDTAIEEGSQRAQHETPKMNQIILTNSELILTNAKLILTNARSIRNITILQLGLCVLFLLHILQIF